MMILLAETMFETFVRLQHSDPGHQKLLVVVRFLVEADLAPFAAH